MEWLGIVLGIAAALALFGVLLSMRIRRDRSVGTEGSDLLDDEDAKRHRDDPEVREWNHGGPI